MSKLCTLQSTEQKWKGKFGENENILFIFLETKIKIAIFSGENLA
jgi:hypothetical protein